MMRFQSKTVAAALLASIGTNALAAEPNSCVSVIKAWRDAVDCQVSELVEPLTWADGFTKRPNGVQERWSDIGMSGSCPKYRTTLRDWRVGLVRGNRQNISLKSIARRVAPDGSYSGDYSIARETYTCEQRGGQWRIFSKEVTRNEDFVNKVVSK